MTSQTSQPEQPPVPSTPGPSRQPTPRLPAVRFMDRHIGPDPVDVQRMLDVVGVPSLDALADRVMPAAIRSLAALDLPPAADEHQVLAELSALAGRNTVAVPMIGLGYYGTHTPGVVLRNVLE